MCYYEIGNFFSLRKPIQVLHFQVQMFTDNAAIPKLNQKDASARENKQCRNAVAADQICSHVLKYDPYETD